MHTLGKNSKNPPKIKPEAVNTMLPDSEISKIVQNYVNIPPSATNLRLNMYKTWKNRGRFSYYHDDHIVSYFIRVLDTGFADTKAGSKTNICRIELFYPTNKTNICDIVLEAPA